MPWELDEHQREAVESEEQAVMVVAGPGTGKTRVLTARIVWLTEEKGVDPDKILAITYTNRATAEMRTRLHGRSPDKGDSPASEVQVSTFHSWAYQLVRKYYEILDYPREPVVFDEDAQEQLLMRLLGERRIPEEAIPVRHLKQLLDRVKAEVAYPLMDSRYDPEHFELISDLFRSYQEELRLRGALDFADILLNALRLLYMHPDIRDEILSGIEHLLIDEFQDINPAQYRLIEAMSYPGLYLFAVGDEDQTIYAFRGSSGVFIDQFVADFNAKLIPLGTSYRCSDGILYSAGSLIAKNQRFYQLAPKPPSDLRLHPPLGIFELEDEEEEAHVTAKLINSWVKAGAEYRDIAILYRVHYLADECESYLINQDIPVLRLLPDRQRDEVPGDPLPLLRLASHDTEWDWDRAIGLPRDRLGELDDLRVRLAAIREGVPLHTLLGRPSRFKKLSSLARTQLSRLDKFVKALRRKEPTEAPSILLNLVTAHLYESKSPWRKDEDQWLKMEERTLCGIDCVPAATVLDEWRDSKDGIRIFHAPTITALLAAGMLETACVEILGIKVERIALPFPGDEMIEFPVDGRPVCLVGLNYSPEMFFLTETLLSGATYLSPEGVSDTAPESAAYKESYILALVAHKFASDLVGYRPGGGEDEVIVFFDLETTGTNIFRSEIVEIAAIKVLLKGGEYREVGEFHSLVKPRSSIPAGAKAVHGISDDDVSDAPSIADVLPRFLEFIGDAPLAGHNIDKFDVPILRRYASEVMDGVVPNLTLDTLPISRRMYPDEPHRLGVLADKFGIDKGTAHRALDDVRTNIGVFNELIATDDDTRARAFSQDLPVILAVAYAVDQDTDADAAIVNTAAARLIARYEGEIGEYPFVVSLAEDLSPRGLDTVVNTLKTLSRTSFEMSSEDTALAGRIALLREEALRLEDESSDVSLAEFLAHIALLTNGDFDSDEDAVRMMTLHAAKGLEFERVIILGLEQGNLPHRLALGKTVSEIEEERRLMYVGITRARKRAALVYVRRRNGFWRSKSMFLHELPKIATKTYRTKDRISGE